jgi:hypothetical protein
MRASAVVAVAAEAVDVQAEMRGTHTHTKLRDSSHQGGAKRAPGYSQGEQDQALERVGVVRGVGGKRLFSRASPTQSLSQHMVQGLAGDARGAVTVSEESKLVHNCQESDAKRCAMMGSSR